MRLLSEADRQTKQDAPTISHTKPASPAPAAGVESRFLSAAAFPLAIWLVDEEQCGPYETFARNGGASAFYRSLTWRCALMREGVGTPFYLLATRGDEPVGVLPLVEQVGPFGMRRLSSLPGTPEAGVWTNDDEARDALLSKAAELAAQRMSSECVQRVFKPAQGRTPGPGPVWLRLDTTELLTYAREAPRPAAASETSGQHQQTLIQANLPRDRDGVDRVLVDLAASKLHPGHLTVRNVAEGPASAAVWVAQNGAAHLLAYNASDDALPDLMLRLAERLVENKVRVTDVALGKTLSPWTQGLLAVASAQLSVEEPLPHPAAQDR